MRVASIFKKRTKIVCTLGPSTGSAAVIRRLILAGMDVARLNLSHGTLSQHADYIQAVRQVSQRLGRDVAILIDLTGPKYRTGNLKDGRAELKNGSHIVLTTRPVTGDASTVPVNIPNLPRDVKPGDTILVDDGALQLKVLETGETDVKARVIVGGLLTPRRGLVVPGMHASGPFLTDSLRKGVAFAIRQKPDYLALSFVSTPEDVTSVKDILKADNASIPVITKIEQRDAIRNFDSILAVSDGIMVARGDLGVGIPLERVPLVQKDIIRRCNRVGKPVITATEMLESMVNSARPTRAETTDVANAIFDGTDATMLSAETSIGKYPVEAVRMMTRIAEATERHLDYEKILSEKGRLLERNTEELISYDACHTAHQLKAAAIVAFTHSGSTAARVSKYRSIVPVLAITPNETARGRLLLYWGVYPYLIPGVSSISELFATGAKLAKDLGLARPGDLIVITSGIPIGIAGTTNLLKVERIQ